MKKSKKLTERCSICGIFIDVSKADCDFTPDSDYSIEDYEYYHPKCAKSARKSEG